MSNSTSNTPVDVQAALASAISALQVVAVAFQPDAEEATVTDIQSAPSAKGKAAKGKAVKTTVLNRTTLRKFKTTKAGKAYQAANPGASASGITEGRFPLPDGFHLPTGARKEAIAAWKAAQDDKS